MLRRCARKVTVLAAICLTMASGAVFGGETGKVVRLWEGPAPGAKGEGPEHTPVMYVYTPEESVANGAAVLVLPGGGYYVHAIDHEGVQVAKRLNRMGVTTFVLKYRLKPNGYSEDDAFTDGQRAVRLLRARAKEFGVAANRIGVLGFSAGGHLASVLGVNFDGGRSGGDDPIEGASSRPDYMVICYTIPAPLDKREGREHGWKALSSRTPPAFMWSTHQDQHGPSETAEFYRMLREAGVDAELHIFGGWGPHGLGLAPGDPGIGAWPDLLERWMRRKGFLTGAKRVGVSGLVTIGGKPLHRGWVKLVPIGCPGNPIASAYITEKADGRFSIAAEDGPVLGRHRVEVYRVARAFLTEPSMGDVETFTSDANGKPLEVLVKPTGNEINLDLAEKDN